MKKKIVCLLVGILSISVLNGCTILESAKKEAIEQMEWTKEHNAGGENYNEDLADTILDELKDENSGDSSGASDVLTCVVGEQVEFVSGLKIAVTYWESVYSTYSNKDLLCFGVDITNVGSETFSFSPSSFSVYSDNYAVDLWYGENDSMSLVNIAPGRSATGRIYAEVNPNTISNLEVQAGNVVWVLKGEKLSQVNEDSNVDIKLPEDMMYDASSIDNIAGYYQDLEFLSSLSCNMYSSPEGDVVGNITVYLEGACYVNGNELIKIKDNVYKVANTDNEEILIGFYTSDNGINAVLYIDGYCVEEFVLQEEYIS